MRAKGEPRRDLDGAGLLESRLVRHRHHRLLNRHLGQRHPAHQTRHHELANGRRRQMKTPGVNFTPVLAPHAQQSFTLPGSHPNTHRDPTARPLPNPPPSPPPCHRRRHIGRGLLEPCRCALRSPARPDPRAAAGGSRASGALAAERRPRGRNGGANAYFGCAACACRRKASDGFQRPGERLHLAPPLEEDRTPWPQADQTYKVAGQALQRHGAPCATPGRAVRAAGAAAEGGRGRENLLYTCVGCPGAWLAEEVGRCVATARAARVGSGGKRRGQQRPCDIA